MPSSKAFVYSSTPQNTRVPSSSTVACTVPSGFQSDTETWSGRKASSSRVEKSCNPAVRFLPPDIQPEVDLLETMKPRSLQSFLQPSMNHRYTQYCSIHGSLQGRSPSKTTPGLQSCQEHLASARGTRIQNPRQQARIPSPMSRHGSS